MANDDYEFVPRESLDQLHSELNKLKKGGAEDLVNRDEELHRSIKTLTHTLKGLIDVFHDASLEMKLEENESQVLKKRMDPIESKIDVLIEQNRKIAQGLIAITEAVQQKFDEIENAMGLHGAPNNEMPPMYDQNMQADNMQGMNMPPMEPMGGDQGMPMPPMPPGPQMPQGEGMPQEGNLEQTFGSYSGNR